MWILARLTFGGLAQYFAHDVPGIFTTVKRCAASIGLCGCECRRDSVVEVSGRVVASQRSTSNEDFALGADLLRQMLYATERVNVSLDQLEAIGRQDLERNLAALKDACAQFAPGKTLAECAAKQTADKPRASPLEAARQQLKELKAFVADNNLVSIPGTEEAQVDEAPPYQRWNFAYIIIPGPYEKGLPSVYYYRAARSKMARRRAESLSSWERHAPFTSAHEVWPGHFLQFLHANRVPSRSARFSWDMRSRKAGPTIRKR